MDVTETTVHKLNGKPYYAWKQAADKTWNRVPVKEASTRLLGVIEGSDQFEFYYQVRLPEIKERAELWVPIATTDNYQTVEVTGLKVPGKYEMLKDKEFNNAILYMVLGPEQSKGLVEINYKVQRLERGAAAEQGQVSSLYLQPNAMMPVGGRFAEIAQGAIRGRDTGDLMKARALMIISLTTCVT